MSKSSKTSLNNNDSRTWKPKNSIKFNSSFDEFFEDRLKYQEDRAIGKKSSLKTSSTSYGEIDETTTRDLQGITLRKTKGGKRRRTRKTRKSRKSRRHRR